MTTDNIGTIGKPIKMPGLSFGLPAGAACPRSAELIEKHGSRAICSHCYASSGHYTYPSVQQSQATRLAGLTHPLWVERMVALIKRTTALEAKRRDTRYFRWHDSGDIIATWHLDNIVKVALALPGIRFWLPTHEPTIVQEWIDSGNVVPLNLTIRISADCLAEPAATVAGLPTSTVGYGSGHKCLGGPKKLGYRGECGKCRACWYATVSNVDYPYHGPKLTVDALTTASTVDHAEWSDGWELGE